MSEVKRHVVMNGSEVNEMVYASDHDRIVAELQARVDRLSEDSIKDNANLGRAFKGLEAERDELVVRCRELDLRIAESNRSLQRELKIQAREQRDTLRAEVERLTDCLQKANEQAEHFEREWYLRGDEVERLRKDAERLTWLIDEEARIHGYLAQHGLRFGLVWPNGDQQADLFACPREAIDAALEASR